MLICSVELIQHIVIQLQQLGILMFLLIRELLVVAAAADQDHIIHGSNTVTTVMVHGLVYVLDVVLVDIFQDLPAVLDLLL